MNAADALKAFREDARISHDITRERLAIAEACLVQADKLLAMKEELYALRLAERDATIATLQTQVAELREFLAVVRP